MKNLKSFFILTFCSVFFHSLISGKAAEAQVAPDDSLPTNINQSGETIEITGGAQAGDNLFHSFEQFSVPAGQEAFFNNASDITNIFSRITGSSVSEIDGLIRANGDANLFLLNPNGIIFGPDAALDIGGSFLATTAESVIFEDKTVFDTQNPQDPLLTVSIPVGLQVGSGAGSITNQSKVTNDLGEVVGLEVNPGKNITLVGGDINFNGGNISAPGGQVNLGGLAAPGTVNFTNNKLSFGNPESLANVSLDNQAIVNVRSNDNGGITVNAQNFSLTDGSRLRAGIAEELGSTESRAGKINLNILETVNIANDSQISNTLIDNSIGEGGDVNITTSILKLANNSKIASSNNSATGDAGNVNIKATDSISVANRSQIQTDSDGLGDAGDINLEAENGTVYIAGVETGINTSTETGGTGQSGDINIQARDLTLTTKGDSNEVGAILQASTFTQGNAGNITIRVDETVNFEGTRSGASSEVGEGGIGQGGNIDIQARSLSIINGASIFAGTFGRGNAGNINIDTSDSLVISGTAPFPSLADGTPGGVSSLLFTETNKDASGQGGDIRIDTNNLEVTDGGVLSSRSRGSFPGGNITVNAKTLSITGGGQILTTAFEQGTAGDIKLNVSDKIDISGSDPSFDERSSSVAQQFGQEIAKLAIDPISSASGVYANTTGNSTGDSGSIFISTENLQLSDGSQISANAVNSDGGNIFINTNKLAALNNSDITANARQATGGLVVINAPTISGTEARKELTSQSDITASSELGTQFSGVVAISTLEIYSAVKLPQEPIKGQVVQSCQATDSQNQSKFTVVGSGGLPPNPSESLRSSAIATNVGNSATSRHNQISNSPQSKPIVEAQGWMVNERGNVVLTANANDANPAANFLPAVFGCSDP
jgi:filamentous hemagglutinin family protein